MGKDDLKLIVLGDSGVGKSCVLKQFVEKRFDAKYLPTIGVDFMSRDLRLPDSRSFHLNVWDTAGAERFHSLGPTFYRGSDGGVIVFDVANSASFASVQSWLSDFREFVGQDRPVILVGNKIDLPQRAISKSQATDWCSSLGMEYFEVSAKQGSGVEEAFASVARLAADRREQLRVKEEANFAARPVVLTTVPEKKRRCCR